MTRRARFDVNRLWASWLGKTISEADFGFRRSQAHGIRHSTARVLSISLDLNTADYHHPACSHAASYALRQLFPDFWRNPLDGTTQAKDSATSPRSVRSHGRRRACSSSPVPGCTCTLNRRRARSRNGNVRPRLVFFVYVLTSRRPGIHDLFRRETEYRWSVCPNCRADSDEPLAERVHRAGSVGKVFVDLLWLHELSGYLS